MSGKWNLGCSGCKWVSKPTNCGLARAGEEKCINFRSPLLYISLRLHTLTDPPTLYISLRLHSLTDPPTLYISLRLHSLTDPPTLYIPPIPLTSPTPHSSCPLPSLQLDQIANQPREVGVPLPPMVEQELQNITETLAMTLARQNATGRSTFPSDLETVNMFLATITR